MALSLDHITIAYWLQHLTQQMHPYHSSPALKLSCMLSCLPGADRIQHTGLSPMAGDEGMFGSAEAADPEDRTEADETSSPTPPAEPTPGELQHASQWRM